MGPTAVPPRQRASGRQPEREALDGLEIIGRRRVCMAMSPRA